MGKHHRSMLFLFTLAFAFMVMAPGIIAKPMPGEYKDVNKQVQTDPKSGNYKDDQADPKSAKKDGQADPKSGNYNGEAHPKSVKKDGQADPQSGNYKDSQADPQSVKKDGQADPQSVKKDGQAGPQSGNNKDSQADPQSVKKDGQADPQSGNYKDSQADPNSVKKDGQADPKGGNYKDSQADIKIVKKDGQADPKGENYKDGQADPKRVKKDGQADPKSGRKEGQPDPKSGGYKDGQADPKSGKKDVQADPKSRHYKDGETEKKNPRLQYARKAAMDFGESNSTRRDLTGCAPTNPIDNCWRCRPDWAQNRQALGRCALGFGRGTTGGSGGPIYVVSDPSDLDASNPKDGTLRFGAIQDRPLWITFARDMVINLRCELLVNSDKTIDGRGAKVEICNGGGLTLSQVNNIIIHGITIRNPVSTNGGLIKSSASKAAGPRGKTDGDAIQTFSATRLWIDHCSLSNSPDGLIDVTMASTAITISNCLFTHQHKAILLGANNAHTQDKNLRVTLAYNRFTTVDQRMPRCRMGIFQVVNNDYCRWGTYAIGGSANPTIISQGNRFLAPDEAFKKQVTMRSEATEAEWKSWCWRSQNDLFLNGAFFVPSGGDVKLLPEMIPPQPAASMDTLTRDAGALICSPGSPC